MASVEKMIQDLPPDMRKEAMDFIEFLHYKYKNNKKDHKFNFSWVGALKDLRDQYTSVELQHKSLEWWGD